MALELAAKQVQCLPRLRCACTWARHIWLTRPFGPPDPGRPAPGWRRRPPNGGSWDTTAEVKLSKELRRDPTKGSQEVRHASNDETCQRRLSRQPSSILLLRSRQFSHLPPQVYRYLPICHYGLGAAYSVQAPQSSCQTDPPTADIQ